MNKEKSLSVGDTIKCYDKEDLLNTHNALAKSGITTEFEYELNGEKRLLACSRENRAN